ncbi:hypothetical protein ACSLOE_30815, partial [Escherichia coli]|uniref:hypothetical protein n=1 Tax=Escherichia coli TaxID=562 RepID=UPI003EE2E342
MFDMMHMYPMDKAFHTTDKSRKRVIQAVNAAYRLALHVHSNSLDNHSLLSSTDSKNDWHRSTIRVAPS